MIPLTSNSSIQSGKANWLFITIAVAAIAIGVFVQTGTKQDAEQPEFTKTILLPTPKSLGDVTFTDHDGNEFSRQDLLGKWSILFFGFTNCPDICPTTMQTLKQVKQSVSEVGLWKNYQVIMISVDPERDSTERLKNYVPFFDAEFIGLSAEVDYTTEFAKNVGILFFKRDPQNGGYDVDHGASLILINPQGQYAGVITGPHKAAEIGQDLIKLANYAGYKNETAKPSPAIPSKTVSGSIGAETPRTLTIENAWIRPAPPTVTSMAAYFELTNNTDRDIVIVGGQSPAFNMTMIHQTLIEDGLASMQHLDQLMIPAGERVSLTPMGTHIMLMGRKQPVTEGDSVKITLIGEDGSQYSQDVLVQQPSE